MHRHLFKRLRTRTCAADCDARPRDCHTAAADRNP